MKIPNKQWLILLAFAGCGAAWAALSLAAPGFTSETAAKLLQEAIAQSDVGRTTRSLPLTGTSAIAALDRNNSPEIYVTKIIQDMGKAIKMSDTEYAAFVRAIDDLNRSHNTSQYGTIPNTGELNLFRTLWKSGNIERFKWTAEKNFAGNTIVRLRAIPTGAVRARCISYSEGNDICTYAAAQVTLKSVDGVVTTENRKRVEFTVHVNPTPDEEFLRTTWPPILGRSDQKWKAFDARGIAILVKYDDGWRVGDWTIGNMMYQIPM